MNTIKEFGDLDPTEKKIKPISLRLRHKKRVFLLENMIPGEYALLMHTNAKMWGGNHFNHYIDCNVHFFTSENETILEDTYPLHARRKYVAIEFSVPRGKLGILRLVVHSHAFILPLGFYGKLLRKPTGLHRQLVDTYLPFDHLVLEDIKQELERGSKFCTKAFEAGIMRPFLLLVSMHPASRQHLSRLMHMNLIESNKAGCSHAEAWRMVMRLSSIKKRHWWNVFPDLRSWREILLRIYETVHTSPVNSEQQQIRIDSLEVIFLKQMEKEIQKQMKENTSFREKIAELMNDSAMIRIFRNLEKVNLDSPFTRSLLISHALITYKEAKYKFASKQSGTELEQLNTMSSLFQTLSFDDMTASECKEAINNLLLNGLWRASDVKEEEHPSSHQERFSFRKILLVPAPVLVWPSFTSILAVKRFFGTELMEPLLLIVHILLQKLLLATQNINIEDYY